MRRAFAAIAPLLTFVLAVGAQAQISVRSDLSDDREVAPGTTYEGVILVRNDTDVDQQAKIYQSDYLFFHDGTNRYDPPGTTPRSNAGWVRVGVPILTLAPGETLPVQYVVEVPHDLGGQPLEGSYWSMIFVEAVPPESPESTLPSSTDRPRFGVRQVLRYGVQVATHIVGTGETSVQLSGAELARAGDGATRFHFDIMNDGSRFVEPGVEVELFDAAGQSHGRRAGIRSRIYPGTSVRQRIELTGIDAGSYRALVVVDGGGDEVFAAWYSLDLAAPQTR